MRGVIPFGRVAGIRIGASWTWLPVVALIMLTAASDGFPRSNPGLSNLSYIGMAVAAGTLYFGGLLLHELGHAIQARREGMQIDGITLWLFGGVARINGEFRSAAAELRVAAAGPAVTLVISEVCLGLGIGLPLPAQIDGVLIWVGYFSALLLVFNLVPAYPLDGGRMLHAVLWAIRRNRSAATDVSAAIGRGFGIAMIAGGLLLAVSQGEPAFGWLSLMGLFLMMAATGESQSERVREVLDGLTVADVIERDPICVLPTLTLAEFFDAVVWSQRHTTYPVFDGEQVVGMLPFRSVAAVPRTDWEHTRIGDVMVPLDQVELLDQDAPLGEAIARLAANPLQRGLVIEDGRLVGLVSVSDVARAFERRARSR